MMALAILSFVLLSAQVWVRTFEQYDARSAQRFKGEAMRLALSTLSDRTVSKFANASAFFALHKLVNHTSLPGYELDRINSADPLNNQTGRVPELAYALMLNGSAAPRPGQPINYTGPEKEAYTVSLWREKIRSAAEVMGFNATISDMQNFTFRQDGPWNVLVYFELQMDISDFEKTMHQSKRLKANATIPIDGFLDPFIRRSDARQRCGSGSLCTDYAERQFFRDQLYSVPGEVRPQLLVPDGSSPEGNGWFFGPVTDEYPTTLSQDEIERLSQYILVHGYDENLTTYAESYGAVILTQVPGTANYTNPSGGCIYNVTEQTNCLNCVRTITSNEPGCTPFREEIFNAYSRPYMAIGGSSWLDSVQAVESRKFILMDNEFSNPSEKLAGYHRIWDITALRDATVCGFYLQGSGPSFFQRMVQNPASLDNPDLGLETFVVGKWAGGALDLEPNHPLYSRLDWEFYGIPPVVGFDDSLAPRIKGMPGCKSLEMCSGNNATEEGVGIFRVSPSAAGRYLLGNITCTPGQCG